MWFSKISSIVFTRVKTLVSKRLKKTYPNLNFTDSDKEQKNPQFPTVYIHELPGIERGQDLDNTTINAVLTTMQIDVIDNVSQNRANKVMGEVISAMKSMRFSVVSMPEFQNTTGTYRQTARFRRVIGSSDKL